MFFYLFFYYKNNLYIYLFIYLFIYLLNNIFNVINKLFIVNYSSSISIKVVLLFDTSFLFVYNIFIRLYLFVYNFFTNSIIISYCSIEINYILYIFLLKYYNIDIKNFKLYIY